MNPRPALQPALRRFENLLVSLPQWQMESSRQALLRRCLQDRTVYDSLRPEGAPIEVAGRVLEICAARDPESLCILLEGLDDLFPSLSREIQLLKPLADRV